MPEINGQEVGFIGYGLMGLTWRDKIPSDELAFAALRAALHTNVNFWNGGEFYGPPGHNSPALLARYFAKHPADAAKVVLSIKGAYGPDGNRADGSAGEIRRSIDATLRQLQGRKKIDVFECARRDPQTSMEETLAAIQEYVDRGLVGGIALSEVSAQTIHDAVKLSKIVAVEVELSLLNSHVLRNGVAEACAQHDIPLVAYSPIARGMLSGRIKTKEDIPDLLRDWPQFRPENFNHNIKLVQQVRELSDRKGCTPAQFAISWTVALSRRAGMPTIIPIPGATTAERVEENSQLVQISDEEMDQIDQTLAGFTVKGRRYPDFVPTDT